MKIIAGGLFRKNIHYFNWLKFLLYEKWEFFIRTVGTVNPEILGSIH